MASGHNQATGSRYAFIVSSGLARMAMQGQPLPTTMPIYATAIWIAIFIGVVLWRFTSEEF
jgi:hypothetical protein